MTISSELINEVGRVDASITGLNSNIERSGNMMQQALKKAADQADKAGAKMSCMHKGLSNVARGVAAGLGFGSIDQIVSLTINHIRSINREAERARQKRIEGSASFLEGTGASDIFTQAPKIREALRTSLPTASDDGMVGVLSSIRRGGATIQDPAVVARLARFANTGPLIGASMGQAAELASILHAKGSSNAEDLAANIFLGSGRNMDEAIASARGYSSGQVQYRSGGAQGSLNTLLASTPMSEADRSLMLSNMIEGVTNRTDPNKAQRDRDEENRKKLGNLSANDAIRIFANINPNASWAEIFGQLTTQQRHALAVSFLGMDKVEPFSQDFMRNLGKSLKIRDMLHPDYMNDPTAQELFRDFAHHASDRIQEVRIAPGTQVIGDDQP